MKANTFALPSFTPFTIFLSGICLLMLTGCISRERLNYFQDAEVADTVTEKMKKAQRRRIERIRIQPYDILDVQVNTPDENFNKAFNNVGGRGGGGRGGGGGRSGGYRFGYSVEEDGVVDLPVVGEVNVLNLTIRDAENLIQEKISEYVRDPFVRIKFLNYKVFVLGEVAGGGLITINNESATVLEAIAQAGGLQTFARRENVRVFRGPPNNFQVFEMDLTSVEAMESPGYYLKPYDVIYVEPLRRKTILSNINTINAVVGILNTTLSFLFIFLTT
jgi:polysaccharide export outer membrane protein